MGCGDKKSSAGLTSQSGCQKTYPTLCPNRLSADYQSPPGAQERRWASGPAENTGPWEAPQASRHWRRWKAPPWGRGGRWVKAAETELTRTPQPQVPQALSEQRALSPLEVCVRGNWRRQHHSEPLGFSKHNVQHATKNAKKGVTTNRTGRKRTEPDPEGSEVYRPIRAVLEASDANFTVQKHTSQKEKFLRLKTNLELYNNSD